MADLQIQIINASDNPVPVYATEGSSGMDVRAFLKIRLSLNRLNVCLFRRACFLEIPGGYEAQVRPRSGMALKQGITCLNTPGTIDSDYRGEIKVLLINLSAEEQHISNGDRIAQLVIAKTERAELIVVQQLEDTLRGAGGFGHTGVK